MIDTITKDEMHKRITEFRFHGKSIPGYMREGIVNYFCEGILPGGFLTAVLSNECRKALDNADDVNMWLLPVYYSFLYNCAPLNSWGSKDNVYQYIRPFAKERQSQLNIRDSQSSPLVP